LAIALPIDLPRDLDSGTASRPRERFFELGRQGEQYALAPKRFKNFIPAGEPIRSIPNGRLMGWLPRESAVAAKELRLE